MQAVVMQVRQNKIKKKEVHLYFKIMMQYLYVASKPLTEMHLLLLYKHIPGKATDVKWREI